MNWRSPLFAALALVAICFAFSCSRANDVADVNASVRHLVASVNAKDVNGIMEYYTPDESLIVYDAVLPREYVGAAAYRKDWEDYLSAYPGAIHAEITDWKTETDGNLAYGRGIFQTTGLDKDGKPLNLTLRVTDIYHKQNGKWLVVHEHVSWPVDLKTGLADMLSKP
jgi:ketosteroid isomerase-like protein